ncbi:MAG: NEDD8-conjugating protein ubc12 [Tremellales sp. Tagirdzhanova-0007]|nr:MAG: NEDD8-conjugating protein ubc12 [Tremellales sp. Tagirdzhanova-0007]
MIKVSIHLSARSSLLTTISFAPYTHPPHTHHHSTPPLLARDPPPHDPHQIWSVKKTEEAANKKRPKMSAAQLRVQKDLTELELPNTMKTHFPDPADVLNFNLTITPDEGIYKGGDFRFTFAINPNYPHEPPKVRCTQKGGQIYHPNLDLEGNVCLNILREDWKPVLNLSSVMIGLQYLFLEPNPDDPLNKDAAEDLRRNREGFVQNVKTSMRGGSVKGETFDRVLKS